MHPDHKKILRAVSLELRRTLEGHYDDQGRFQPGDLERRLNEIGIWRDRPAKPLAELPHLSPEDYQAHQVVDAYLDFRQAAGVPRAEAVAEFGRESAYTWANRLLALRCMEARGLIDEIILQKEVYGGRSMVHSRFARRNPAACAGEDDGLFAVLLAELAERAAELPALFNPASPATALRPSIPALKRCLALLSGRESARSQPAASDEVFAAPDALGWAYQYWNAEEKDRVFEKVRTQKGAKIEGADIIPATQLYTEPYMVKFLVQNSLGATWLGLHPESKLAEGWEYYVKDADRAGEQGSGGAGVRRIQDITFLDPAAGSGHFLLEAFDLFYQMYEEEAHFSPTPLPPLTPADICASILNHNLFGIDIDERAIQIAQAALWMKAKEYAPDLTPADLSPAPERSESPSPPAFFSHLIATNLRLPRSKDHLETFLAQHPEDRDLRPALETVFEGLANAHELGSLLQIEEPVEKELRYLQAKAEERRGKPEQLGMFAEYIQPKQGELPLDVESFAAWQTRTLARLKSHFEAEAEAADLGRAFFGRVAGQGLALFDLLARRYDVVAANPPYMGSKNMGAKVKSYLAKNFAIGKRDVYAAFILRSIELCLQDAKVGMITLQSWMFLTSFADVRLFMLQKNLIQLIAHLGRHAFSEADPPGNPVMFVLKHSTLAEGHRIKAFRLTASRLAEEQAQLLRDGINDSVKNIVTSTLQSSFLSIPNSPLIYWMNDKHLHTMATSQKLKDVAKTLEGLNTTHNLRFIREFFEIPSSNGWIPYTKGGGYSKWSGLTNLLVRWDKNGERIKTRVTQYSGSHWSRRVSGVEGYFKAGWGYSLLARGRIGVRELDPKGIFDVGTVAIFPHNQELSLILPGILNSHLAQYFIRGMIQSLQVHAGYLDNFPVIIPNQSQSFAQCVSCCIDLKNGILSTSLVERDFKAASLQTPSLLQQIRMMLDKLDLIAAHLHSFEFLINKLCNQTYDFLIEDENLVFSETGTPAGWHPLLTDYDQLPPSPAELDEISPELLNSLHIHQRLALIPTELANLKNRLFTFYEAGPGAKTDDLDLEVLDDEDEENEIAGANIPIPPETFLEELSVKLQIHPISVYWLLKEGREQEGWRCLPEEKRLTEDRFTVLVLRLLGHRWPKQIEAGEAVPTWADADGIIPLTPGLGEATLVERVRKQLVGEQGSEGARERSFPSGLRSSVPGLAALEREFEEIVGESLEKWLAGSFFKRHISQFKKRPIAWQLESSPSPGRASGGGRGVRVAPAFSCLIYYHKLDDDLLPKLRTQYVGPLRSRYETELRTLERLELPTPDQAGRKLQLEAWIDELKAFEARLERVAREGFDSPALRQLAAVEPLDEWTSRDGLTAHPSTPAEILQQETRYAPDLNDGGRVNIAPLQKAGLLAAEVLARKDLEPAIANRAEWRADERRWCREGKLSRPGWW